MLIDILQDREKKLNLRAALILEIARDVQECIDEEDIFSMDDVFDYYRTEEGIHEVETDFAEADHLTYIRKNVPKSVSDGTFKRRLGVLS